MGVLQLLPTFYEEAKPSKPQCGDVYWVPVPFVDHVPRVLEVLRADPYRHEQIEFAVSEIRSHHFKKRDDRLPIKLLRLESTEEAVVAKAKRRPCVVLC